MNNVAVTDGDKVEAEIRLDTTWIMPYRQIGSFYVNAVKEEEIDAWWQNTKRIRLCCRCSQRWCKHSTFAAATQEIGLRRFLEEKVQKHLHPVSMNSEGMDQLMGFASQRLDGRRIWFRCRRRLENSSAGSLHVGNGSRSGRRLLIPRRLHLNFDGENSSILQAHMLEINPDIAKKKPQLQVHFGIGDAGTCARLVFQAHEGQGVACTIVIWEIVSAWL